MGLGQGVEKDLSPDEPPAHIISFNKEIANWLDYDAVYKGDKKPIILLEEMQPPDDKIWKYDTKENNIVSSYIFEGRKPLSLPDILKRGVLIYQVENGRPKVIENKGLSFYPTLINPWDYWLDPSEGVKFSINIFGEIQIDDHIPKNTKTLKLWVKSDFQTTKIFTVPDINSTPFDVNLYATSEEKTVGLNVTSNIYEMPIDSAEASGNVRAAGSEWITLPNNVEAYYIIDASLARKWLEENNESVSNITVEMQVIRYDENGMRTDSKPMEINASLENPIVIVELSTLLPYNISFLSPITTDQFNITEGSTLPIKFTAGDKETREFIYDETVNFTITNSTGTLIAKFNTINGIQIKSDLEQYAVDFNALDYPELTIGETCTIQVTFGDGDNLRGYAIAHFTIVDRTPPASITNLTPTPAPTYINWTWTNPPDPDFNHTEIYLDGAFQTTTSSEYFNATDLTPATSYTISTRTVDTSGNINQTWMNDTATTLPAPDTTIQITISLNSGWNLISAPLNLATWKLGNEAAVGDPLNVTPENSLTSIYRYNNSTGSFEKCTHYAGWGWDPATGSEGFTELEPGRGYWAWADNNCDLTFTGTAPSNLDVPLDADWNCVGWYSTSEALLGEEAAVGDPLNVTPENSLTSIYRYNSSTGSFEKCTHYAGWGWDPATGSESFTELEPGRGYWVMAKNGCVWNHKT